MKSVLYTAPVIEPVTLNEVKYHLGLPSVPNYAAGVGDQTCTLAAVGTYTLTVVGAGSVAISAGTAVGSGWATATAGAPKTIIVSTAGTVALDATGSVTNITLSPTSEIDPLLSSLITTAREYVEDITGRALLTQTWDCYADAWPETDRIILPSGNLQSVTSVTYTDTAGNTTTMAAATDYLVETNGEHNGAIVLPYGVSWPSVTLYPSNPIAIRIVCGWETAALVPYKIKAALLLIIADLFVNRESQTLGSGGYADNKAVDRLLASSRLWK